MAKSRKSGNKEDDKNLSAETPETQVTDDVTAEDASDKKADDTGAQEQQEATAEPTDAADEPVTDPDAVLAKTPEKAPDPDPEKSGTETDFVLLETDEGEKNPSDNPWSAEARETDPAETEAAVKDVGKTSDAEKPEEDQALPVVTQTTVREVHKGSMWPAVFGGVIAALIGFIAGRGDQLDAYLPESMQRSSIYVAEIESWTDDLSAETAALSARIEALENAEPAVADTSEVSGAVGALATSVEELSGRISDLESRPVATEPGDSGASAEEIAALQAALDEQSRQIATQSDEIATLQAGVADAEAAARSEAEKILARAALTRVVTAVESGEAFEPALNDLEEVAPVEVPEALRTAASDGVPTISDLRESFPGAARAGLAAAREHTPEAEVQGVGAFLRRTLGARSVTPRDGDDPDAILSRSEAALKQGDLSLALSEMEALPEPARTAMQDWISSAEARQAARDAATTLSDSLQSN
ncbi:COG4223 family protein [Roseobacter ponti]|uniref:Mitochondrial inner membrane protein n=1 Tax=Roseobacter ponti TaxID=1891787 RepID=A0A858SPS0_9RHOB|nr:mitofilin family membrane protein [Roseobacter ponti]QJF49691.1 hypothetical protein G3256_00185 [Roseobacter ponti]